jgi:hypothetical protein
MRKVLSLGLLAATLAGPAIAQKPEALENNLRCITVLSAITGNLPEAQRAQMAAGVMYFVGQVDGQAPGTDLKVELRRLIPTLTPALVSTEAQRCGAILTAKGAQLQDMGKALQEGTQAKP